MEEKKEIKMSLGTTICIFIIILLIIALTGMYLYFNKDSKNNTNNIAKVDEKVELQQQEENKSDTGLKEDIRDYEYKETITLNNKTHEIGFVYEEINSKNQDENFPSEELKIFFDGKKVKTYTVYRETWEKQENPEIQIIEGEDNRQYAIIVVGNINPVSIEYKFDFINDNGEIIGLADYNGGTSMIYKGKELSYKINKTNMEIYKPIMIGESGNDFVIKYVLRVGNNFVNYSAEEIYKADEVEFAGARI